MMRISLLLIVSILSFSACKNSEKSSESNTKEKPASETVESPKKDNEEQVAAAPVDEPVVEQMKRKAPSYPDTLFFRIQRTACFGQCPTYIVNIYSSGWALMDGQKFWDYEGMYSAKFSEEQLLQIESMAKNVGYSSFENVYDAPVTDLPSTTTILNTENIRHWVYNRMNSPDELRSFEREVETLIKAQDWKPYTKPAKPKKQSIPD